MMSRFLACEIVFSIELVEYLGGRRWALAYDMDKVSSKLEGMAL
jgi:hypothetical protein